MNYLGAILLVIAVTVKADRIYFPDEIEKIANGEIYYRPLGATNQPNYQPQPPPANSKIAHAADQSKFQDPSPTLATLVNILPPYWRNHVNNIISRGMLKFALDVDRAISDTSVSEAEDLTKNVIFSPLSLAGTMAMVLLASGGQTFNEVVQLLGLQSGVDISHHSELVHQMFGSLIEQINRRKAPGEPIANFASGIFVQDGFPIRPEFREISDKVYKSEVMNLDFQHRPLEAQQSVNSWVNNKTNGMIKDILQSPPSDLTKVILASALYFRGEWNQYFFEKGTRRKPFFIEPGKPLEVDMMYNGGEFPFYEDKSLGAKIIGLPYKGREVTMYLILPKMEGARNLKHFENSLTPETVENLIENMKMNTCIIGLPRMKLSSTLNLREALKYLGVNSLFQPGLADLSLLSPGRQESNQINHGPSSRLGDSDEDQAQPLKHSVKYRTDRYTVEQWTSGFDLRRMKRSAQYSGRRMRQNRPVDNDFLAFVNSQSFPTYGLDDLRNSRTTVNPQLFAEDVVHKVEININEKGTEAAAATSVVLNRSGDQRMFVANRPFLFFIRHDPSKLIWFWGTVNKPEPHY